MTEYSMVKEMSDECTCTCEENKPCCMHDIIEKLHAELPDEISDSNMYLDLAETACAKEDPELHEGLMLIAHDEFTHARFIYETLNKHCIAIDSNVCMSYKELVNRIEMIFEK